MKPSTHVALLAVLVCASASAQDINVYSTTLAQVWKQDTPGFDKSSYAPATQFLGIDANKLGTDAVSLHLYGWGSTDLRDQSSPNGKAAGNLTYGYLQYTFEHANAELKAGRFTVNQGVGTEQVDGLAARTDLKGGFSCSFFAGKPVLFKNLGSLDQQQIDLQRDFMFGARFAYRLSRMGEIGVSYLQDGSTPAKDLPVPVLLADYTRKQVGVDLTLSPCAFIDFSGRTVFEVAGHYDPNPAPDPSRIAEHDYNARFRVLETLSLTGTFVQRDFRNYYAGSTLPNLFNMNEKGEFRATGASATWAPLGNLQVVTDVRRTSRELYGDTTRFGTDLRYTFPAQHVLAGVGYHKVNAFDVKLVDIQSVAFSLSHSELRAWVMCEKGAYSASFDAIRFHYEGAERNPNLNGKSVESELIGSLGYQLSSSFKLSGDLSLSDTPVYQKQVMGLLRAEYRFGFTGKGGK